MAITQTDTIVHTPVTELLDLKEVYTNLPKYATRELDLEHVKSLAETDHEKWPPIQVVEKDEALVIIDGYHRVAALKRQKIIDFLVSIGSINLEEDTNRLIQKHLEAPLSEEDSKALEKALDDTLIRAEIGDYKNEKEVFKAALTANLKHGLAPKGKALVHIALALYDITRDEAPVPSQAEIARIVGISRAALNEYIQKRAKEEGERQKEQEEGGRSQEKDQDDKTHEKALKSADRFIASLEKLFEESPHAYTQVIQKLFPVIADGMSDIHGDYNDKTYLDSVSVLLTSSDNFTSANIPHIGRLARALTGATKKIEKQYSSKGIASRDA